MKVQKEPVIQKVDRVSQQRELKQTQGGKDSGMCCSSTVGKEGGEKSRRGDQLGSCTAC